MTTRMSSAERPKKGDSYWKLVCLFPLVSIKSSEQLAAAQEVVDPLLAQGHGECNDPNCECRTKGPAECHGRQVRES